MSNQADFSNLGRAAAAALREHWVYFLVEGVVLLVLGATAIAIPELATIAVTIIVGWLLLVSGVVGLFTTFWMRAAPGFVWSLLSAILAIVVGLMLLASPLRGAVSLTLLLVIWGLNSITLIYAITGGGPANLTLITPIQIFRLAFESFQFNQAAALSVVFFLVAAVIVAIYVKVIPATQEEAK